jgi:hypothetical protein
MMKLFHVNSAQNINIQGALIIVCWDVLPALKLRDHSVVNIALNNEENAPSVDNSNQ